MSVTTFLLEKYNRIPQWIPGIIAPFFYLIPSQYRYGKTYRNEIRELERISHLSDEEVYAEKQDSLRKLIAYSYKHVPYYHRLFDTLGISPTEIFDESDLIKIPFLTKEDLVNNFDELVSDEFSINELVHLTTSGSTGVPTAFLVQKESGIRDWAYGNYLFRKFGYCEGVSKLILRGKSFYNQTNGDNYQWDPFKRELSINIFDMKDTSLEEYCRVIEKYKPQYAVGYMSAMYMICAYIKRRGYYLKHKFQGFFAISETITKQQRDLVQEVIGARVFSCYGMSERVIYGSECEDSTKYHIEQLYGIAEIVSESGEVIRKNNIKGELVGTSLLNYAMPLIRYRTGDISSWADSTHINAIEGRKNRDVLINSEGIPISMASLEVHSDIYSYMKRYQFYQDEIGMVKLYVMLFDDINKHIALEKIKQVFTERTMSKICFEVIEVDEIRPKKNGKYSIIDQRMNIDKYLL